MKVTYAKGTTGITAVLPPIGGLQGQGFSATFWPTEDFTGAPAGTKFDSTIDVTGAPLPSLQPPAPPAPPAPMAPPAGAPGGRGGGGGRGPAGPRVAFSARWEGTLTPATTGVYRYAIGGAGVSELRVDGKLIATARAGATNPFQGAIDLVAGKPVALRVDYTTRGGNAPQVRLGWQAPDAAMNAETDNAAKSADVALVFVGERLGEGSDKPVFNLPADQDALIDRVATANPRTIVVLNAPTAVAMPWIDKVAGVVYAGYAGQFSGDIIAKVLFGDVNPSGKLPITFPVDASQGPGGTPASYPGLDGLTVARDEGILLGYKYYDAKNQAPLFPFGFGLSYTTFTYGPLKLSTTGATRTASIPVTNSGTRDGAEIVQLYLSYPAAADEPPRVLKGFDKVALKSKETKTVSIPIDAEALSVWDEASKAWKTFPGTYTVSIGASSRDIKGKGTFAVTN
jgi:beta-glucosidase